MVDSIISEHGASIRIAVHLKPRASRNKVLAARGGMLELAVTAPPVDGAANQAVRELFSKVLGVPLRDIVIVMGESSRKKLVGVSGVSLDEARTRLGLDASHG